jgi:hypothetical protein
MRYFFIIARGCLYCDGGSGEVGNSGNVKINSKSVKIVRFNQNNLLK